MELRHFRYFDAIARNPQLHTAPPNPARDAVDPVAPDRQLEGRARHAAVRPQQQEGADDEARPDPAQLHDAGRWNRSTARAAPARRRRTHDRQAAAGERTPSFNTRMVPLCVATFLHHYPASRSRVEELSAGMIAKRAGLGPSRPRRVVPAAGRQRPVVSNRSTRRSCGWWWRLSHPLARRRRVRMVELHHVRMVLLPAPVPHAQAAGRLLRGGRCRAAGRGPAQFDHADDRS